MAGRITEALEHIKAGMLLAVSTRNDRQTDRQTDDHSWIVLLSLTHSFIQATRRGWKVAQFSCLTQVEASAERQAKQATP